MTLYAVRKKYGNTETVVGDVAFASKLEARRYAELLLLERAGAISGLKVQEWICLQPPFVARDGKKILPVWYVADFVYIEDDVMVVEETKGFSTPVSLLKMKMLKHGYPHYDVRMVYAKPKAKAKRKARAGFGKGRVT